MVSAKVGESEGSICHQPVERIQGRRLKNVAREHFLKAEVEEYRCFVGDTRWDRPSCVDFFLLLCCVHHDDGDSLG